MKTTLKNIIIAVVVLSINAVSGCKKDSPTPTNNNSNSVSSPDTYSSLNDFYSKNGVQMQTYTVNGATGGTIITPQGTKIRIPANAFVDQSYYAITGPVTIKFKDIYKKSDMLMSNMATMMSNGAPLKSGGEFFIKALSGNAALILSPAKSLTIVQPNTLPTDTSMSAYAIDSVGAGWGSGNGNYVVDTTGDYLYSLTNMSFPVDSGTWGNTDNPMYFNNYSQTNLTLQTTDTLANYRFDAYLIFKTVNTTIEYHTYPDYYYAPLGLQCTLVVVAVKLSNSKLYSAFVPITITANLTVSYTLSPTTTADFKSQLSALN